MRGLPPRTIMQERLPLRLSMRRRLLDIAVFIARHIVDHWWSMETASTHLRTAVDAGRPRIGMKGDTEDQLCVPAVKTRVPSE
jgi:hypothetical protein